MRNICLIRTKDYRYDFIIIVPSIEYIFYMEIVMHLKSVVDGAFLANGVFVENNGCVRFDCKATVYATVFPSNAAFLPYTVRFCGNDAITNRSLVSVVKICENKFVALFNKRYECVFAPEHQRPLDNCDCGIVNDFFGCVKSGDMKKARAYLTQELSGSVDDDSLRAFFDGYTTILSDEYTGKKDNYFLVGSDGVAHAHKFSLSGNLIDDITEQE